MPTHKLNNDQPQWFLKVGEKLREEINSPHQDILTKEELTQIWSRIETSRGETDKPLKVFYWKSIGSYAAGILILLSLGLSFYLYSPQKEKTPLSHKNRPIAQVIAPRQLTKESNKSLSIEQKIDSSKSVKKKTPNVSTSMPEVFQEIGTPIIEVQESSSTIDENIIEGVKLEEFSQKDDDTRSRIEAEVVTVEKPVSFNWDKVEKTFTEIEEKKWNKVTFASVGSFSSLDDNQMPQKGEVGMLQLKKSNSLIRTSSPLKNNTIESLGHNPLLYDNATFKHYIPIRIGVRVSCPIIPKLSLETGLRYTNLTSKVSNYTPLETITQTIQYIGIPLGVNMELFRYRRLSLYTSLEGAVDKAIFSKLGAKNINITPWQFSVSAGAGISFSILPQLSLYLTPGISYYFNDHSLLKTYYKENPLHFSISMGIRFNPFVKW